MATKSQQSASAAAPAKQPALQRFMQLFRGYEKAHGEHDLAGKPDEHGKIKGRARTVGIGALEPEYKAHLSGSGTSLGLIPLMADDTCWFGAIDIDIHGEKKLQEPIEKLEARIRKLELPLVVCRSKSGGAHLYLFARSAISAKVVQGKLLGFAASLGYGGTEVFPKQVMRANENDRGNWINIAYYGALSEKGTERYCIRNGKPILKLEEFCQYAEMMAVDEKDLQDHKVQLSVLFEDGPPCLQHMATYGFEVGGRNISLTNVAIYMKKKFPDDWADRVMKFNYEHMKPEPLESSEVTQINRNVGRKDYFYTCKNPPLCNHCDKKACVKREFGVTFGKTEGELFPIDNITKCVSKDSVRWYAEHSGHRIELTTEQLLSPQLLQKAYLEKFSVIIIPGKASQWHERLRELMESCEVVQDPDDASRQGQFEKLVENFFTASVPARNREEIVKGNSFREDGKIIFRSEDLFNYLTVRRFNHSPHEVWMWLKSMGAEEARMRIAGKQWRLWTLPSERIELVDQSKGLDLPSDVEEML